MRLVVVSMDIKELPNKGEAWLVDGEGTILAKFYDGSMSQSSGFEGNSDPTKLCS